MTIPPSVRKLLRLAGVDRAVGITLIARVVALVSAPVTLFLQLRFLTNYEQGYFVTFAGIIGLVALLELGLTQAIAIFAGHEMAALKWELDGALSGSATARARLRWLLRLGTGWYAALGLFLVTALLPFGFWYYGKFGNETVAWRWPWMASVIVGASNLCLFTPIAILENTGMIAQVAVMRLQQTICGNIASWTVLALGGGLFALPAMNAASLVVIVVAIWRWRRRLGSIVRTTHVSGGIRFWHDIWPLQWRLGLSWMGGYSTNYLVPLAVFTVCGDVVAGQFGLSSQLGAAIQNLSLTWVTTQMPHFMRLVAQANWRDLDAIFAHRTIASLIVMFLGAITAWLIIWALNWAGHPDAGRFVAPLPFALIMINTTIVTVHAVMTFYIRAHKIEPLYPVILVQGIILPAAAFLIGKQLGVTGVAMCMIMASLAVLTFAAYFCRAARRGHGSTAIAVE